MRHSFAPFFWISFGAPRWAPVTDAAAGGAADLAAPSGVVVAVEWGCGRPLDGCLVASASSCWVAGFVTGLRISFFVVGVVSYRIVTDVSAHLIEYRSV